MKLYLTIVSFLLISVGVFGVALPFLISAASTELVMIGWLVLVLVFPVLFFIGLSIFKQIKEKFSDEESS